MLPPGVREADKIIVGENCEGEDESEEDGVNLGRARLPPINSDLPNADPIFENGHRFKAEIAKDLVPDKATALIVISAFQVVYPSYYADPTIC
jgi:hypothetical protein